MNNVNMNKYDATQACSICSANKFSLNNQQSTSNQSNIHTGREEIYTDKVSQKNNAMGCLKTRIFIYFVL